MHDGASSHRTVLRPPVGGTSLQKKRVRHRFHRPRKSRRLLLAVARLRGRRGDGRRRLQPRDEPAPAVVRLHQRGRLLVHGPDRRGPTRSSTRAASPRRASRSCSATSSRRRSASTTASGRARAQPRRARSRCRCSSSATRAGGTPTSSSARPRSAGRRLGDRPLSLPTLGQLLAKLQAGSQRAARSYTVYLQPSSATRDGSAVTRSTARTARRCPSRSTPPSSRPRRSTSRTPRASSRRWRRSCIRARRGTSPGRS